MVGLPYKFKEYAMKRLVRAPRIGPMGVEIKEAIFSIVVRCAWGNKECSLPAVLFIDKDPYCAAHYNESIKILKEMERISKE